MPVMLTTAGQLLGTGTKTRTKDQIDEEVDFIGATLSTSSSGVFASSFKKHTTKLLDIVSDVVLNPVFKQEELDKIKKQTLSNLAASAKDDPSAIAASVNRFDILWKGSSVRRNGNRRNRKSITFDMCKKYYDTYFHPNMCLSFNCWRYYKTETQETCRKIFR